jgi:hypothetical protein
MVELFDIETAMPIVWFLVVSVIYARVGSPIFTSPDVFTAAASTAAASNPACSVAFVQWALRPLWRLAC